MRSESCRCVSFSIRMCVLILRTHDSAFESSAMAGNFSIDLAIHLLAIGLREGAFRDLRTARDLIVMLPGKPIEISQRCKESPLLLNAEGTEPLRASVLEHHMSRSFKLAGFAKDSTFYSLRKGYARRMEEIYGLDLAKQLMGHTGDSNMLETTYRGAPTHFNISRAILGEAGRSLDVDKQDYAHRWGCKLREDAGEHFDKYEKLPESRIEVIENLVGYETRCDTIGHQRQKRFAESAKNVAWQDVPVSTSSEQVVLSGKDVIEKISSWWDEFASAGSVTGQHTAAGHRAQLNVASEVPDSEASSSPSELQLELAVIPNVPIAEPSQKRPRSQLEVNLPRSLRVKAKTVAKPRPEEDEMSTNVDQLLKKRCEERKHRQQERPVLPVVNSRELVGFEQGNDLDWDLPGLDEPISSYRLVPLHEQESRDFWSDYYEMKRSEKEAVDVASDFDFMDEAIM